MDYVKKFLFFDEFIAPKVITFIYWFSLVAVVFSAIAMMTMSPQYGGGGGVIRGLLCLVILPIVVRVYFEIIMVIFNINKNLQTLADAKSAEKKS